MVDPETLATARYVHAGASCIGELLNPRCGKRSGASDALRDVDLGARSGSVAKPPVAAPGRPARHPKFPGLETSSPSLSNLTIPTVRTSGTVPVAAATNSQSVIRVAATKAPAEPANDDPRFAEIKMIASQINQRTLFEALGVTTEATAEEIKTAYFALAKVWHPDRLPPELIPMRSEVNTVFARMSLAYQTLSDAGRRKEYVEQLATQQSPEEQAQVARVLDAANDFQKAEVLLKKGDVAAAEELALRAVKNDPQNPDYDTLLAWLRASKPGATAQEINICVGVLGDVLKQHPEHLKALWYRGCLFKRVNNDDLAVEDFRKILKLKPNNIDAEREVRLYEMRNRKASSSQPPAAPAGNALESIKESFGKLFKR
ncbi:MAG: J domain-containing protein [Polyangiaceae bacterium]